MWSPLPEASISVMNRFAIPRAGRPEKARVTRARFAPLRDNGVDAGALEGHRLLHVCRCTHQEHSPFLDCCDRVRRQDPERETEDRGRRLERSSELRREGIRLQRRYLRRREPQFRVVRSETRERQFGVFRNLRGTKWREEAYAKWALGSRLHCPRGFEDLRWREIGGADESERARFRDGGNELRSIASAGERRLDDGMAQAETVGQGRREGHASFPQTCRSA